MENRSSDGGSRLKSAYEMALERMEQDGIERPRDEAFSENRMAAMQEVRQRAQAKLAELEILHRKTLASGPVDDRKETEEYQAERRRVEDRREREIARLRDDPDAG